MRLLLILFIGLFSVTSIFAQDTTTIDLNSDQQEINGRVSFYRDYSRSLDVEKVKNKEFITPSRKIINIGYSTDDLWLRFSLKNISENDFEGYLQIDKRIHDSLQLYSGDEYQITGVRVPASEKETSGSGYLKIQVPADTTKTYYLKVSSSHGKVMNMSLINQRGHTKSEMSWSFMNGLLIGSFLLFAFYNFSLALRVNDNSFYFYVLSNLGILFVELSLRGFFVDLPSSFPTDFAFITTATAVSFFVLSSSLFCLRFLKLREYSKTGYFMLIGVIALQLCFWIIPISMHLAGIKVHFMTASIGTVLFAIAATYSGSVAYKKGNPYAIYYLYGWTAGFVGVISYTLQASGVIPNNWFTNYFHLVTCYIELLMLSIALSSKYRDLRKESRKLEVKLNFKEEDLNKFAIDNQRRHTVNQKLTDELQQIDFTNRELAKKQIQSLLMSVSNLSIDDEKQIVLQEHRDQINSEFVSTLKTTHPDLTKSELDLCSLIKLGYSTKKIANLRDSSIGSVKVAKSRIKKKVGISQKLDDYLREL